MAIKSYFPDVEYDEQPDEEYVDEGFHEWEDTVEDVGYFPDAEWTDMGEDFPPDVEKDRSKRKAS